VGSFDDLAHLFLLLLHLDVFCRAFLGAQSTALAVNEIGIVIFVGTDHDTALGADQGTYPALGTLAVFEDRSENPPRAGFIVPCPTRACGTSY
jgi:hypothetical protein